MNTATITETLNTYSKAELITMLIENGIDRAFGIMTRNMAELFHSNIDAGKSLVFVDIANMHGMNHSEKMGFMPGVDKRIDTVLAQFRHSDLWIRWGGDEIVVVLNSGEVCEFISRLDAAMAREELYAVYGIVETSTSLVESVKRASNITMACKAQLEKHGLKAGRDDEYVRLTSQVVCE